MYLERTIPTKMDFNKLFKILAVDLSGYGNNFKEMKLYTAHNLAMNQFNHVQLPSDFFALLLASGRVNKDNLGILYSIYANSHLNYDAKNKAFKDIEEFNFYNFSFEATKILKNVIETLVKYPVNTHEMKGVAAWIPEEYRTGEMKMDHKASIMKLVELKLIHAFDLRILQTVFRNNSDIIKTIIEPGWMQILGLNHNYIRNKMPILEPPQPPIITRPSHVSFHPQSSGQDPSPVEQYSQYFHEEFQQFVPRPYHTEMGISQTQWSPDEEQQQQQHAVTNIHTGQSPRLQINPYQQFNSPNYELPSPPSMEDILREVQYEIPYRDVLSGVYPGECLIINIEKFKDPNMKDRIGSSFDVKSIETTFNNLGFHTTIKEDLTSEDLLRYLKEKSLDKRLSKVGMFVCFLMSHGEEGRISGSDGQNIEIETIITNFKNDQCLALQGKPKIFFVQACRGNKVDEPKKNYYKDNILNAQPQDADLMICQATTKGKVAVRTDEGSWYINKLCEIIRKGHQTLDLMQIHTKVNHAVSQLGAEASTLQVSNSSGSLRKTLRFVPNISADDFEKKSPTKSENLFSRM